MKHKVDNNKEDTEMAIIEKKYTIGVHHVGIFGLITNSGILNLFEDIACSHSDMAGYGLMQIPETHLSWVLLNWKVYVLKRVKYGTQVTLKTWARCANSFFTLRDFEMYDDENNLVCIASTKWTLIDVDKGGMTRIPAEVIGCYKPQDDRSVFGENDIKKIKEPELPETPTFVFQIQRRDIDVNGHMHNLYYLDYAYEALPQNVYEKPEANRFEIMYKSGAKLGNSVACYYVEQESSHYVVMKNPETNVLHAIVKFHE